MDVRPSIQSPLQKEIQMKIGFVSLPVSGHLNPMTALARKLQSRGHEVVFFGVPDAGPIVRAASLTFVPFAEREYPLGSIAEAFAPVAKLHGLEAAEYTLKNITAPITRAALERLSQPLVESGVEALAIDTGHRFLELVPISLNIPFVQIWPLLHLDRSGTTPPFFFSWPHETTPEARARNIEGLKKLAPFYAPVLEVAKSYAEENSLQIDWSDPSATVSKLAVITQTPKEFDLPGIPWPPQFHYAGPFHDDQGREPAPFPWEKLNGAPLIYASLGTLVNGLEHVYKTILDAAAKLPEMQVVLSIGKTGNLDDLEPVPSNTIIVRTAPQIELLKRAALCITHAGLNTALESLAQGVPMVAIPISYDQPGVASRIAYHGVGEFINLEDLRPELLLAVILAVVRNPNYGNHARYFQEIIAKTRGLDLAAEVIEQALQPNTQAARVSEAAELSPA
jgi:zeaxanthin glucosyltransferase